MKAISKVLAGGVAIAALASAAPAAAQYYPGYGYPGYGYGGGNVVGQVLNQVLGGGYGNYGGTARLRSTNARRQCSSGSTAATMATATTMAMRSRTVTAAMPACSASVASNSVRTAA